MNIFLYFFHENAIYIAIFNQRNLTIIDNYILPKTSCKISIFSTVLCIFMYKNVYQDLICIAKMIVYYCTALVSRERVP